MSNRLIFENPKKSAWSIEYCDSTWEYEYMEELENDPDISKWTKNHEIKIDYVDEDNHPKRYEPDFLVERVNGQIEIVEIKGKHLLHTPNTRSKKTFAEKWCKNRGIKYKLISKD